MSERERIEKALEYAFCYGQTDSGDHRLWVIDQMVRALTGCPMVDGTAIDANGIAYTYTTQGESDEYQAWIREYATDSNDGDAFLWDVGIPP